MNLVSRIRNKLSVITNEIIEIYDISRSHATHYNNQQHNDASHIRIRIVSTKFINMTPLARHKMIYHLIQDELTRGLHALSIEAMTPDEYAHKFPS